MPRWLSCSPTETRIKKLEESCESLEELFEEEVRKGRLEAPALNASESDLLKTDRNSLAVHNAIQGIRKFLEKAGTPVPGPGTTGYRSFWTRVFRPSVQAMVALAEIAEAEGLKNRAERLIKLSQRREAYLDLHKIVNDYELPCPAGSTEKRSYRGLYYTPMMTDSYRSLAESTYRLRDNKELNEPGKPFLEDFKDLAESLHGVVILIGEQMYRHLGDHRCDHLILSAGGVVFETHTALEDMLLIPVTNRTAQNAVVTKIKHQIQELKATLKGIEQEQEEEDRMGARKEKQEESFLQKCGVTIDNIDYPKVVEILTSTESPKLGLHNFKSLISKGMHGYGGNSNIFQAINKDTSMNSLSGSNELLSVKIHVVGNYHTDRLKSHCKQILREAYYWALALSGEGVWKSRIAPLCGVCVDFLGDSFGTPSLVTIWREDGNLLKYANLPGDSGPGDKERRRLIIEVAQGLAYLHNLKEEIVHGDLKSENVLVCRDENNNTYIQLIDFGSAHQKGGLSGATSGDKLTTMIYEAPEVSYPGSILTTWSDMYAYAFVLLEVIYKIQTNVVFVDPDTHRKLENLPKNVDKKDILLVTSLWSFQPRERLDASTTVKYLQDEYHC